jgi:hypothetical protein
MRYVNKNFVKHWHPVHIKVDRLFEMHVWCQQNGSQRGRFGKETKFKGKSIVVLEDASTYYFELAEDAVLFALNFG